MKKTSRFNPLSKRVCIGGILVGSASGMFAQDMSTLAKENQDLKARVDALEQLAQKEGLVPSGSPAPKFVSAMSDISISGFVQASYFYNTRRPADGYSDGYLWNTKDNSFSINKIKLTIASKPVATDKWDAGFRASLLFGDDAPDLDSPGANGLFGANTSFNDLREAYVELNVPIGAANRNVHDRTLDVRLRT